MAGNIFLKSDGQATVLNDTGVSGNNSLTTLAAGNAAITTSPGVDNTTNLDFWMDIEAVLFFVTSAVSTTVTYTPNGTSCSGSFLAIYRVAGMPVAGLPAVRSSGVPRE